MTDYIKVGKGIGIYILGVFYVLLSQWIIPPLIEVLGELINIFFTDANIVGIGWFALLLTWILATYIIPNAFVIDGINTESDSSSQMLGVTSGVLWLIFGLALTVVGFFMVNGVSELFEDTWLKGMFWGSLIIHWILVVIVTPANKIISTMSK